MEFHACHPILLAALFVMGVVVAFLPKTDH
jgi:hypothetical protein